LTQLIGKTAKKRKKKKEKKNNNNNNNIEHTKYALQHIVFLTVEGEKIRKEQKQSALYVTSIQRRGDDHRTMEPC
jgi:hypothetical protein